MKFGYLLAGVCLAFAIQGCALFSDLNKIENTKSEVCNYDGAFAKGTSDAKAGYPMNSEYIKTYCGESKDPLQGYRDGYLSVKK